MKKHISAALIILIGLGFGAPSVSAEPAGSDDLRDVAACREISKAKARLRCFDRATEFLDGLSARSAEAKQTSPDKAGAEIDVASGEAERQKVDGPASAQSASYDDQDVDPAAAFGAEDLVQDEDERPKQLSAIATSITQNKRGKYIIVLENGQVWRQIQADVNKLRIRRDLGPTYEVLIKRRALGAYALRLTTAKRSILVRRIK